MNASCVPESVPRNLLRSGHELAASVPECVDGDNSSRVLAKFSFPMRLHILLTGSISEGCANIVGWVPPDDTRFRIHDEKRFEGEILPLYFDDIDHQSFQDLLKCWDFQTLPGGQFYHKEFRRDHPELCFKMTCRQEAMTGAGIDGAKNRVVDPRDEASTHNPSKSQENEMSWMASTFVKSLSDGSLQVNAPIIEMLERQTGCDMETVLAEAVLAQLQAKPERKRKSIHPDTEHTANPKSLNKDCSLVSFGSTTCAAGIASDARPGATTKPVPLHMLGPGSADRLSRGDHCDVARPPSRQRKRRREQHSFAVASALQQHTSVSFIASYLAERERKASTIAAMTPSVLICRDRFVSPFPSAQTFVPFSRSPGVSPCFAPHLAQPYGKGSEQQPAQAIWCKSRRIANEVLPPTDLLESVRPSKRRSIAAPGVSVGHTTSSAPRPTTYAARHVVTEPCLQTAAARDSDEE